MNYANWNCQQTKYYALPTIERSQKINKFMFAKDFLMPSISSDVWFVCIWNLIRIVGFLVFFLTLFDFEIEGCAVELISSSKEESFLIVESIKRLQTMANWHLWEFSRSVCLIVQDSKIPMLMQIITLFRRFFYWDLFSNWSKFVCNTDSVYKIIEQDSTAKLLIFNIPPNSKQGSSCFQSLQIALIMA